MRRCVVDTPNPRVDNTPRRYRPRHWASQRSPPGGSWSTWATAPTSGSPMKLLRLDAVCAGGTVTPCTMTGTWIAWCPPSDRQPRSPANRQSLMLSRQQSLDRRGRERVVARKREQEEAEAARRQEEEAVISVLRVELRALCAADPGMSLLTAVEFITSDPARRIALYRLCSPEDRSIRSSGMGQDDPGLLKIASSVAKDLAFLSAALRPKGFRFRRRDETVTSAWRTVQDGSGHGPFTSPALRSAEGARSLY